MIAVQSIVSRLKVLGIALLTATLILGVLGLGAVYDVPEGGVVASGEVSTTDGSVYMDRSGTPTAVGEIVNDRRGPITDVVVTVRFLEDGDVVGVVETTPAVSTISPRSAAPFSVRLETDAEPDAFDVEFTFEEGGEPSAVSVSEREVRDEGSDSVTVGGEVTNEGELAASPIVVVTFYDDRGTVIGYRTSRVSPDPVEAGDTAEFQVRYSTLGDVPSLARQYADYRIVVEKR